MQKQRSGPVGGVTGPLEIPPMCGQPEAGGGQVPAGCLVGLLDRHAGCDTTQVLGAPFQCIGRKMPAMLRNVGGRICHPHAYRVESPPGTPSRKASRAFQSGRTMRTVAISSSANPWGDLCATLEIRPSLSLRPTSEPTTRTQAGESNFKPHIPTRPS